MLLTKLRQAKSKKGMTLVEMLAAIAITAILATVLSMMIVPVINTYRTNETKVYLAQAVTARLNDMALYLRGAKGVYVGTAKRNVNNVWYNRTTSGDNKNNYFSDTNTSKMYTEDTYVFPEIRWATSDGNEPRKTRKVEFDGLKTVAGSSKRCYCFVLDNYYERYKNGNGKKITGYLYPELIVADWSNNSKRFLAYGSYFGMKLSSDEYQESPETDIYCPSNSSMFFYVHKNPDNGDRANVLEMHLTLKKGSVTYEGVKTIVCENLVINEDNIYTVNFTSWSGSTLNKKSVTTTSGTDKSKWTKYYTIWFILMN